MAHGFPLCKKENFNHVEGEYLLANRLLYETSAKENMTLFFKTQFSSTIHDVDLLNALVCEVVQISTIFYDSISHF